MHVSSLWQLYLRYIGIRAPVVTDSQVLLAQDPAAGFPDFAFSESWHVLGPFQIGTREAAWGADPLELHGGFRALEYNETAKYRSSVSFNSTVTWSESKATLSDPLTAYASAQLHIDFPDIDWHLLQNVYGWAALQWQGWARGEIYVQSTGTKVLALSSEQIIELWVDGVHYFGGDMYGNNRAAVVLHLGPGKHRIDIRLVRDVRAMGGVGEPALDVKVKLQESSGLLTPVLSGSGDTPYPGVLISEIVGDDSGPLASPYGSVTLRNDALTNAFVIGVEATHNRCEAKIIGDVPINIVPGQTRPIAFRIACVPPAASDGPIMLSFRYLIDGDETVWEAYLATWPSVRGLHEPQKVTHMHPGGIVSYSILRPPSKNAMCTGGQSFNAGLPVLLFLHGAGLEADNELVRRTFDSAPDLCAWVVYATGVTPWSADDWHTWGFADVEAAIAAIPDWIEQVGWKGPGVDVDRWLVSGHSNGGQGVWYTLTHQPDKVIAAAAVSGYISIQEYVPYSLWRMAEPGKTAIVQGSLNTYRHGLLLENAKGIPILQQHGSADDNVPAYHSRLLSQLLGDAGVKTDYVEMEGKPHWWDGIMTTDRLLDFYQEHLTVESEPKGLFQLSDFTVVSAGYGDMGAKHGVEILQLETPGELGKVYVNIDPITLGCRLHTSNVRSLRLPALLGSCSISAAGGGLTVVNHTQHKLPVTLRLIDSSWHHEFSLPPLPGRHGRQLGSIEAILRTQGAFEIVLHSQSVKDIALQISRNLCQYFAADTSITGHYEAAKQSRGNIISLAIGADLPREELYGYARPIRLFNDRIEIVDSSVTGEPVLHAYTATNGLAAIFLRALPGERVELVVWGVDEASLDVAARLVPLMTGTGQPDFVVADRSMLWKGVEGTLAMGFFDERWGIGRNTFFT